MRYVPWVGKVFRAVGDAGRGTLGGGVSLRAIGAALGFDGLADADFKADGGPGKALVTAMYDLDQVEWVDFNNVDHGNALTAEGRDLLDPGLAAAWPDIFDIPASEAERTFLAQLHAASADDGDGWADLRFVDADPIYTACGFPTAEYADTIARHEFYRDLERKRLIRPESRALGSADIYRTTYLAAVLVSEADPRHGGAHAGLIDWSIPSPGFEVIEEHLTELKTRLDGAITDADLSDVGLRCRSLLVDIMTVVYRPEMVAEGTEPPRPDRAAEVLIAYMGARLPGKDHEAYRLFLRGALALASARVHSERTGRASAVAAAQGTVSFLRAIQAIERTPRDS